MFLRSTGIINSTCSRLGFYSLGIYVTHYLIIWYIADWIVNYVANTSIAVLLVFVIALPVSLAIVLILNKNKITARLLLGKLS